MQRIMNNPDNIVDEMVAGFLKAHSDIVEATENKRVVKSVADTTGRVGVVTGGGSGHKPAFIGYVGKNMCDAVAIGEIFSSPTAAAFLDAFKAADGGKGVACLYGNYSGDNMNVKMAVKMAKKAGITVKTVVAAVEDIVLLCEIDFGAEDFDELTELGVVYMARGVHGGVIVVQYKTAVIQHSLLLGFFSGTILLHLEKCCNIAVSVKMWYGVTI